MKPRPAAMAAAILGAVVIVGFVIHWVRGPGPGSGQGGLAPPVPGQGGVLSVDLYFADAEGDRLALERREIADGTPAERMRRIFEELAKGPVREDLSRTIPSSTALRGAFYRDGIIYADLEAGTAEDHPGGAWTEVLAVWSIVNSLCGNFTEAGAVQILVDGREAGTLVGHVDISRPLEPRLQLLAGEW